MMKITNFCVVLAFILLFPAFISGQTAAEMDAVLESQAITCSQAAFFVLASYGGDASADKASGKATDAFEWVISKGWLPKGSKADEPITMGTLSLLMVKAFDIEGGFMYSLFPSARYAIRAMVNHSYIQDPVDPDMKVSGERFLIILGNVLNAAGETTNERK